MPVGDDGPLIVDDLELVIRAATFIYYPIAARLRLALSQMRFEESSRV